MCSVLCTLSGSLRPDFLMSMGPCHDLGLALRTPIFPLRFQRTDWPLMPGILSPPGERSLAHSSPRRVSAAPATHAISAERKTGEAVCETRCGAKALLQTISTAYVLVLKYGFHMIRFRPALYETGYGVSHSAVRHQAKLSSDASGVLEYTTPYFTAGFLARPWAV